MLRTFQPHELWKIARWENTTERGTFEYLSKMAEDGKWNKVPPVWVEPNYILNTFFATLCIVHTEMPFLDHFKPYVLYSGHHRLEFAKNSNLPLKAYVRWTPRNPPIPEEDKKIFFIY